MGMGEACRKFNTPVTGGNVSFYNEDQIGNRAVYPTPTIGMMGIVDDLKHITTQNFKDEGDVIILIGKTKDEIGGSEYLRVIHDKIRGDIPDLDLDYEKENQQAILELIKAGALKSCHDISDGGLAVALAECCISDREKQVGCRVNLRSDLRNDTLLFAESQSRFIVTVAPTKKPDVQNRLDKMEIDYDIIGLVAGDKLIINDLINLDLSVLDDLFFNTLYRIMDKQV
jgi:phosphoribosylformylglycinamidine synthase subunit PurL